MLSPSAFAFYGLILVVVAMALGMPRRFPLFCTTHLVLNALIDDLGALFGR